MDKNVEDNNVKLIDQTIFNTEQKIIKAIEESNLHPTVLELIIRNIHLQLQNIIANERLQQQEGVDQNG